MKARLLASIGATLALAASAPAAAQSPSPSPSPAANEATPALSTAQIDQLVAPVALYPDPVLSKVLMAATYPVEVVEADRWRQASANSTLSGDALAAALDRQSWDPSVKSLVSYPQILSMMDGALDWTEALGEAFIADPDAVMDEIQKLRRQAEANGELGSSSKEAVTTEDGDIDIEPADESDVYVPSYNPVVIFAPWPYPEFPPYYFPGYFTDCVTADFGDCWVEWPIFLPYWGWDHWDWRHHHIDIDRGRFMRLDHGHPPPGGDVWRHEPSPRRGAPYETPHPRVQLPIPAGAQAEQRARGFPAAPGTRQLGGTGAGPSAHAPPTFESYGQGREVRSEAARGASSRMSVPSYAPRPGGAPSGGFRGGGGVGAGRGGGGHR